MIFYLLEQKGVQNISHQSKMVEEFVACSVIVYSVFYKYSSMIFLENISVFVYCLFLGKLNKMLTRLRSLLMLKFDTFFTRYFLHIV